MYNQQILPPPKTTVKIRSFLIYKIKKVDQADDKTVKFQLPEIT